MEGFALVGAVVEGDGGGALLADGAELRRCVLRGNKAGGVGGGAYGGTLENCLLVGNTATTASGGAAVVSSLFRNNRLSGNRAATGGGLHAKDTDGHDCLVTSNAADRGAGGTTVLGNSIAWDNAGGNLDIAGAAEVRYSCAEPLPEGEGNFAESPAFVGEGDYHLRAGSPCVDMGENQPWMAEASDFDGQRRVEIGEDGDGRDIWVDIGADEAVNEAVKMPSAGRPFWTWRVVLDANLQLQRAVGLLPGTVWEDVDESFTVTEQRWTLEEPFDAKGLRFYRLLWLKE